MKLIKQALGNRSGPQPYLLSAPLAFLEYSISFLEICSASLAFAVLSSIRSTRETSKANESDQVAGKADGMLDKSQ